MGYNESFSGCYFDAMMKGDAPRCDVEAHPSRWFWPKVLIVWSNCPRDAKINELHNAVGGEQDIARFDVTVCNAASMNECERREDLVQEGLEDDDKSL